MSRARRNKPGACGAAGRVLALLLCLAGLFLLPACDLDDVSRFKDAVLSRHAEKDDLDRAMDALKIRDIADAEMYFERYLRKNPTGEERWEVWQELMDIALNVRQDKTVVVDYLEIMLAEYADDSPRRIDIQLRLASLCGEMRRYGRAMALWEDLIANEDVPENIKAGVYRDLSRVYLRRLETAKATQMLTLCLELDVTAQIRAECLFDLAETQSLTGEFAASEQSLQSLLNMQELASERRVMATFMMADALEQQERLDEAARYYESVRESYPNPRVVEIRLNNLRLRKENRHQAPRPQH